MPGDLRLSAINWDELRMQTTGLPPHFPNCVSRLCAATVRVATKTPKPARRAPSAVFCLGLHCVAYYGEGKGAHTTCLFARRFTLYESRGKEYDVKYTLLLDRIHNEYSVLSPTASTSQTTRIRTSLRSHRTSFELRSTCPLFRTSHSLHAQQSTPLRAVFQ